jgi:alkylation response protein AidB-like acyl-CoA dehydrogenase
MDATVDQASGQFELNADQRAIQEMAAAFAGDRVAPNALEWDKKRYFPSDVVRETGALGLGGIYIRDDVGGSGLGRMDAVLIFEALARACPAFSAFISIHNMAAWMIDRLRRATISGNASCRKSRRWNGWRATALTEPSDRAPTRRR